MGVSVNVADVEINDYAVICRDTGEDLGNEGTYEAGFSKAEAHVAEHPEHYDFCASVSPVFPYPDVSMGAGSMIYIARRVGLPADENGSGELPGAEFHALVVEAQKGLPPRAQEEGCFVIDYNDQYLANRLYYLEQVGRWAKAHDKLVFWG